MTASGARWVSHDHVAEAVSEIKRTLKSVHDDRIEEVAEVRPDLLRRHVDGRYVQASFAVGDHVGTLTLESFESTGKGRLWRARCDCGRSDRFVYSANLSHAIRIGVEPCCATCGRERRAARVDFQRALLHDAFRRQMVDHGTLWTTGQTVNLMARVREALEEESGVVDDETLPSLRFGCLVTEPGHAESGSPVPDYRRYGFRFLYGRFVTTTPVTDETLEEAPPVASRRGLDDEPVGRLDDESLDELRTFLRLREEAGKPRVPIAARPPCACPCGSELSYWRCHGSREGLSFDRRRRAGVVVGRLAEDKALAVSLAKKIGEKARYGRKIDAHDERAMHEAAARAGCMVTYRHE